MIALSLIAGMSETVKTLTGFFANGGLFMWPLLACSLVALTTIILRTIALQEKTVLPPEIEGEIERFAPGASPDRLVRMVHHDPSALGRITRVALQHLRWSRAENIETVQT